MESASLGGLRWDKGLVRSSDLAMGAFDEPWRAIGTIVVLEHLVPGLVHREGVQHTPHRVTAHLHAFLW